MLRLGAIPRKDYQLLLNACDWCQPLQPGQCSNGGSVEFVATVRCSHQRCFTFLDDLRRATRTEQLARRNSHRATCKEDLPRATCTEQLAQHNLRRTICTERHAQRVTLSIEWCKLLVHNCLVPVPLCKFFKLKLLWVERVGG